MKRLKFVLASIVLAILSRGAFAADPVAPGPYDFLKRVPISVSLSGQSALGGNSANDVPVLVRISESIPGFSYADMAADGSDLAFGVENGGELTIYPHEIETWDRNGVSLIWVKVPTLSAATEFAMYYGNGVSVADSSTDVWSNYVGVWHLNEASGDASDASGNGLTAVPSGANSGSDSVGVANCPAGTGRQMASVKGNKSYLLVANSDLLDCGNSLTFSGWFKAYDTSTSYSMRYVSRKSKYTDKNGWEVEARYDTSSATVPATTVSARGANSGDHTATVPDIRENWVHLSLVYDDTKLTYYVNGVPQSPLTLNSACSDNNLALAFGNNPSGGEPNWWGLMDELRLSAEPVSAEYAVAEYHAMTDTLLSYSPALPMDETMPVISSADVAVGADGFNVSYSLVSGTGSFEAVMTDVASGEVTSAPFAADSTSVFVAASSLGAGHAYDCSVRVTSMAGNTILLSAGRVFNGSVSVAKSTDADEGSLTPGVFTVTASSQAIFDLVVPYTVGGTAVADQTYEALSGSVVIPAGSTTAAIEVNPIYSSAVSDDVTVSVTLHPENAFVGTATAELEIANAALDPNARYVATKGSDDTGTGLRDAPYLTIGKALSTLDASGGTIWLDDGEYGVTATVELTTPVTIRSVSGNPESATIKRTSGEISVVKLNCATARLLDLTVANGGTKICGGNVFIDTEGGIIEHCIIRNGNTSGQYGKYGGNICMKAGIVTRCVIKDGTSNYSGGGGGVWMSGGQLENSLIIGNLAGSESAATYAGDDGGGVHMTNPGARLINCTIVANRGSSNPGVRVDYDSKAKAHKGTIYNCVIVDNLTMKGTWEFSNVGGVKDSAAAFVNCVTDARIAPPNETCMGAPYAFLDRNEKDYRLTAVSSAVDAGTSVELYSNLDLDGNPRLSGTAIDVGCYEFQQPAAVIAVAPMVEEALVDDPVSFKVASVGTPDGAVVWDFGDGEPSEGSDTATHAFATPGIKIVGVSATIGGVAVAGTAKVKVCPKVVYVDVASTTAEAPFATQETATPSFADGFAWATDGTTVRVAKGTNTVTAQTFVKKGIVIEGATGNPDDVVIKASGSIRVFWISHPDAVLRDVTVAKGKATQSSGSNVYLDVLGGAVSNCVLTGGVADNYNAVGGNLRQLAGLVTHCRLLNSTVNNKGGGNKGGNVQIDGGCLSNSLIADGVDATDGSNSSITPGVRVTGTGELVNCTIAGNTAKGSSVGGIIVASATAKVTNCVIAGNTSPAGASSWSGSDMESCFAYCAVDSANAPNESCIVSTAGALLKDAANLDYHPAPGSPSVDAGMALEHPAGCDLDGNARVQGKGIDMGCYEYEAGALAVTFDADIHEGIYPVEVTYTAVVDGADESASLTYEWDFDGDGTVDNVTYTPVAKHQYANGGMVSVVLKVTDGTSGLSATSEKPDIVKLAPAVIYVDAASESPVSPYASWATAALQPADAVAVAVNGCEIIIRAGIYTLPGTLLVDKAVYLHSEFSLPGDVIFKAGYFSAIEVNHPQAVVSGVTFADANGNSVPGGVYFGSTGGTVSNCVIRNCKSFSWSGNGGAASFGGDGLLTHSVITNCTTTTFGGGGSKYILSISHGRFENCLVVDCYSSGGLDNIGRNDDCAALMSVGSSAVVRNNTFVRNVIHSRGLLSIASGATVANNVFAGNSFASESGDTVDGSTDVGFNFGSSASVAGVPAFANCATDLAEPINESCVVGTAATLFKDYANGDYTPNAAGPLYNAGVTPENAPSVDLAGNKRVQGRSIDIGCFEASEAGLRILIR